MSRTVINLNKARKQRTLAKKRLQADQNAAFHGLTKAQKQDCGTGRCLLQGMR